MLPYPEDLPSDAIKILMKRDYKSPEFALSVWNIQGYLQNRVLGQEIGFMEGPPLTDEQAFSALQSLQPIPSGASSAPIPATVLRQILKWSLKKVSELL
jgi:hypothetical protein